MKDTFVCLRTIETEQARLKTPSLLIGLRAIRRENFASRVAFFVLHPEAGIIRPLFPKPDDRS